MPGRAKPPKPPRNPKTPRAELPAAVGFDPDSVIRHLTHKPGVYRMLDAAGDVIYVGKARDLRRASRAISRAAARTTARPTRWLRSVAGVEVTVTRTEVEALMLEYNLIKQHRPRFNVVLRDDKSYPYIHLDTSHKFPRLSFYRGPRTSKAKLFGPYPSAGVGARDARTAQKLFQLRQCDDSFSRTAAGRACSIRSSAAPRRASG